LQRKFISTLNQYKICLVSKTRAKVKAVDVLLKTYTTFSVQKLLHTTQVGIAKKIQFYLKSI